MENDAQPQSQQQAHHSTRQQSQKEKEVGKQDGKRKRDEEDEGTTAAAAAAAATEGVVKTKKKTKKEVQQEQEERLKQETLQKQHQAAPITPLCWEAFCEKVVPYMQPTDMASLSLVTKESYRYVHASALSLVKKGSRRLKDGGEEQLKGMRRFVRPEDEYLLRTMALNT